MRTGTGIAAMLLIAGCATPYRPADTINPMSIAYGVPAREDEIGERLVNLWRYADVEFPKVVAETRQLIGVTGDSPLRISFEGFLADTLTFYMPGTDIARVNDELLALFPEEDARSFLKNVAIRHALDVRSREIGKGPYPKYNSRSADPFLDLYALDLVREGIVYYYAHDAHDHAGTCPHAREDINKIPVGKCGLEFVAPLLDEYGHEIIPLMMDFQPVGPEVFDPTPWQNRIRGLYMKQLGK